MCKVCWSAVVILVFVSAAMAYKFIVQGNAIESADERTVILLNDGERDFVLAEMRIFLDSVSQITRGVTDDDMEVVAEHARKSGSAAQTGVPGSLIGKLPLAFKKLGFDTHAKFDELALDAEQLGDREHVLSQMSALLNNCVACHSMYKFSTEASQ